MQVNGKTVYDGPDQFEHVALWTHDAEQYAEDFNRSGWRGPNDKFVAGSFRPEMIPGRIPAVVGSLATKERIQVEDRGGYFIAFLADRPTNQPYGTGATAEAAKSDLKKWIDEQS